MPSFPLRVPSINAPASIAFTLLFAQVIIPWTGTYFASQDGPSHLYTAHVAKHLLLPTNSGYDSVYELARKVTSNWGTVLLFNISVAAVGADNAEKMLTSLCFVIGFLSMTYFVRSLSPQESPWTPVSNFLSTTWFLWAGFYNFYLAMIVSPLLVGYYIRRANRLTWRHAAALATGIAVQFLVHVLPALVTVTLISCVASWLNVVVPTAVQDKLGPR